ncbi:MAG: NADPH-dependent F420 reductase [archaeon]
MWLCSMRIGIVGGTGAMGKGLALRWCQKHKISVGSRDLAKASSRASNYNRIAKGFYGDRMKERIEGNLNAETIRTSDVVVVALPAEHMIEIIRETKTQLRPEQVVVSTVVSMIREERLFKYLPLSSGQSTGLSAAELIAKEIEPVQVVSAFETIPASYLADLNLALNMDVLISGNDEDALQIVSDLVRDIPNLRPLRVGPLANSRLVEPITPLLLNVAILNNLREPSIRVVHDHHQISRNGAH